MPIGLILEHQAFYNVGLLSDTSAQDGFFEEPISKNCMLFFELIFCLVNLGVRVKHRHYIYEGVVRVWS